ncbi:MAG: phosphoribosylformylglycinamidine synthase subunit PurL [Candidatus Omnitrophica bacterium]|nr:phosphoribosylformylglycinamidine synthase subunit PurL [Candidatus Omnitrophota bacterium]
MPTHRIEVRNKSGIFDVIGEGAKKDMLDIGIKGTKSVSFIRVYFIEADLDAKALDHICKNLLADPITEEYAFDRGFEIREKKDLHVVEVAYNPGVMDPVEESTKKALLDLGIKNIISVRTAKRYVIKGNFSKNEMDFITEKILCNKVIQHVPKPNEKQPTPPSYKFKLITVDMLGADDKTLMKIAKEGQLFLSLEEMKTIKNYFHGQGRNPTDCELESIAQTWSEHCSHKTFRGIIEYEEHGEKSKKETRTIKNLLKNTVMLATEELAKKWCVSVFKDNSGVIEFDKDYDVCFKVETHNHPSALEPYGGAGTGIGGVIRDPLGTGRGAKPILNTDVFCFGTPDTPFDKLPPGALHPKRVMKGVVSGVRDYGNRMGIPTANGAVLFDERYIGNPLVYCGNVGIMPKKYADKRVDPGDILIVVGGKTGRDGIHGATFSSGELTSESEATSSSAVQIGNPITEKKVTDTILQARDRDLYKAITDCGAGGLSSAAGEMGEETGVLVHLDRVPLKYSGLSYTETWISEAQERMVLAADPENVDELLSVFRKEDVEAVVIGEFTDTKMLELKYNDHTVAKLDMKFLHKGVPQIKRKAVWKKKSHPEPKKRSPGDLTKFLLNILSSWNVCSKEWIIRQYDHEVQGGSVLKPLQGVANDGPGDACVIRPRLDSDKGIIVSNGINFLYGLIDPYWMAASAIDEALRQIIAVGGNLDRVAILDNFCWGNTNKPHQLGELVRASLACYDIAKGYGTPFISGKDSLNNEYSVNGKSISIPSTLLISAMSVIDDVTKTISMDAKIAGNHIYVVGETFNEMGGSHYWKILGFTGNSVPRVNCKKGKILMSRLSSAISKGLAVSCHDCSEGGLGVATAEMAFAGGLGMDLGLKGAPQGEAIRDDATLLFSESNTRFVVEVPREKQKAFEKFMKGSSFGLLGATKKQSTFSIKGLGGKTIVKTDISKLKGAWQKPFSKKAN